MEKFQPLENVLVAAITLGGNALADNFLASGVQNDAFDFGAAEINADAIHVNHRKDETRRGKIQPQNGARPGDFMTGAIRRVA